MDHEARMNNEPAFPGRVSDESHYPGMDLRDWFAGMAMQALVTANGLPPCHITEDGARSLAEAAAIIADEMLRARGRKS